MTTKKKQNKKLSELIDTKKLLATGIVSEELSAIYLDSSVLKYQPQPLYRLDLENYRYYYMIVKDLLVMFTSVTTMIKNTLPTPRALIKWLTEQEDGENEAKERSYYGTFLHECFGELLITKQFDLDKMPKKLQQFSAAHKIQYKAEWETPLKKDLMGLGQFIIDYNVKPIAIEIILYHPNDGYAGAIDLVCEMDWEYLGDHGEVYASGKNKGTPKLTKQVKRINAIVDLKSGKKGFYESHEIQLKAYQQMWDAHFPDIRVDHLFNLSPKDWRTRPSYNLKDQTNSIKARKLPHLIALAKIEEESREKSITILSGIMEPTKGLDKNIKETTLTELITTKN